MAADPLANGRAHEIAGDDDRGEHRKQNADRERDGKAADGRSAEPNEDGAGDERRDVRIADRVPGALKAFFNGAGQRTAVSDFFFHSGEN